MQTSPLATMISEFFPSPTIPMFDSFFPLIWHSDEDALQYRGDHEISKGHLSPHDENTRVGVLVEQCSDAFEPWTRCQFDIHRYSREITLLKIRPCLVPLRCSLGTNFFQFPSEISFPGLAPVPCETAMSLTSHWQMRYLSLRAAGLVEDGK